MSVVVRCARWSAPVLVTAALLGACGGSSAKSGASATTAAGGSATTSGKATTPDKATPAAGTGNVQGEVRYDDKPVAGITVKLCEKFSQFLGGCSGATFTATTDADGTYVVANVPPGSYEGLIVKVFDTDSYVFATSGIVSAKAYEVTAGKTLRADTTNLFKDDLQLEAPAAGSTTSGAALQLRWTAYAGAASYKVSVYSQDTSVTSLDLPAGLRVDGTSYAIPKPVPSGQYRWKVEAYNAKGTKLAESPDGTTFTVQG